ncbi:MAG: malectin domain-containing carbohydrate-binding protein [Cyanobacteria bacterium J06642_2]
MAIDFEQIGSFKGVGGVNVLKNNPTSLQFGPDGRLYVAEQNGSVNAFTVELQNGEYVATGHELLTVANGDQVVKSIQNHDDDGSLSNLGNRQVTGLVVTGTAENPVLYVSSSDPRIAKNGEVNLDTNSGVVTRVTWTGTEWEAVDIIRGLPRSEENHSVNGMVLSPDGNTLYLAVGGNTNNGAPSQFFSYTGEYALSGTVLEIDLVDIESRPILTDPIGGQDNTPRQYVYNLPTLDDPTISNVADGAGEDEFGMDEAGPWGGNDGFNMAVLPADAPLRIFADGLRNHYDLALTESGKLYTVDNGSNANLGGNPLDANGNPTEQVGAGEATNTPNNGGTGDPEPLFLLEDGGYYGHPNPARSNQDLPWTVYDNAGNPDATLPINNVPNLADLVPDGVNIANGFTIDPSKFTGDPARLSESGIRIERDSPESNTLANLGSSSNGLAEYTANSFDGALQGGLLVTQFNGSVTFLNLNADGTAIEPLIGPGEDGILGNADDEVVDEDGIYPLISGQSLPLDVTTGPGGTIWVAEFGNDTINVFAPTDAPVENDDLDGDGILNVDDPFIRDASNGGSAILIPGQTLLWDFDANQDDNLPGPGGYGGGLTGVMLDGTTDYEVFFQEPSDIPGQLTKLDNVKFATAAGGGTTVIEAVSNGNPFATSNDGEYLFHTGVTVAPLVDTFTIRWSVFNPASEFTGSFQQIGGYVGTGDQSNYLKLVAVQHPDGEIEVLLEDDDVVQAQSFLQADDLFLVPDGQKIFFELEIDPIAATAVPTVSYELGDETTNTVSGTSLDLSNTAVLDAIRGDYVVDGQTTGLAVGLLSANNGQPAEDTFQAIFDDIEISATGEVSVTPLYRVNAGGAQVAAVDGGIPWLADKKNNNSQFLANPGSNNTASFPAVDPGATVPESTPGAIFNTERWDKPGGSEMQWAFDTPESGLYEVRLYVGNGFEGTNDPGERVFDVAIEGVVLSNLDDIDPVEQFGHQVGGVISNTVTVTDGTLDIQFLHGVENPQINGIEILQLGEATTPVGSAELTVNIDSDNIQQSNFAPNSFQITNTGDKKIEKVEIDVTNALFPDSVFDPFGLAGDTTSKELTINTGGGTGVVTPDNSSYIGEGGTAGFEGLQLTFDEGVNGGFQSGETVGFSVDMDPNSIAGADKVPLDAGSNPAWDVGGVSGAELIGSTFTVTFTDGSTATGQLQGAGNQAGSQGVASQDAPETQVSLTVNGLEAGGVGTYDLDGPNVIVNGTAGQTVRVVLTKGFIQPVSLDPFLNGTPEQQAYAPTLQAQLDALAATDFPANNAAEFQTVDVLLTGEDQDISELFDFSDIADLDFDGEERLPLGFVASAIDPANDNLPVGPVTQPIYLQFEDQEIATLSLSIDPTSISEDGEVAIATLTRNSDTTEALTVDLNSSEPDEATLPDSIVIPAEQESVTFQITGVNDGVLDGTQTSTITASSTGFVDGTTTIDVTDVGGSGTGGDLVLELYDAADDTLLGTFGDGDTILASLIAGREIAIAASVPDNSPFAGQVESMFFDLNDGQVTRIENVAPYALFGDSAGNFAGGEVLLGSNTLEIDVYSQDGLQGELLGTVTQSFTVLGDPLSLSIDSTSISENGGVATATVTRATDTTEALTVNLSSSDISEATVPESVIIPEGQSSATFQVTGVDDAIADGTQTPTITAAADGFVDGVLEIDVLDDDGAGMLDIVLYDADTDTLIEVIEDGDTILASTLAGRNVTLVASIPGTSDLSGQVESMFFDLNDGLVTRIENVAPYALFGDAAGDFNGGELPLGSNTLEIDVYSQDGLQGELLGTFTNSFTIINDPGLIL